MGTVYKIHPAIGIARLGNHKDAFFIGPESLGSPGVEIGPKGRETRVLRYKEDGLTKRQAARFRVFRFEQDDRGGLKLVGEVTADDAKIEWKVDLCNRKAALDHNPAFGHPALPRNTDVTDRDSLIIRNPKPVTISGKNQPAKEFNGKFLGKKVYLGELRTDAKGRLIVLGGRGKSGSVPDGAPLTNFANNDRWYDDVSDGPVSAVITLPKQDPIAVHHASWVAVAPPDFAPGVESIVTLYDVAFQAAIDKGALKPDDVPSFRRHIKPLIERAAALRWVNDYDKWQDLASPDWKALADTRAGNADLRGRVAERIRNPGLNIYVLPGFLATYLNQWVAGDFISDLNGSDAALSRPEQMDRAALDGCVGNNFFPGIEASLNLLDKDIYARPFRLDHTNLGKVYPGCLTEIMALPWQADFLACDGGVWWPSQRPDIAMTDANRIPLSKDAWARPVGSYEEMVEHVQQLGFIVPKRVGDQTVFVEQERDPSFPREPLVAMAGSKKSGRRARVA
jgi:L-Lysine epsilon oxidase N-terminal/L-lysine epsilon oxidase C-terminal domain